MDNIEVIDVKLIDNSTFALASELIKLEILPPGQEATNIIPSAIEAWGLNTIIKR